MDNPKKGPISRGRKALYLAFIMLIMLAALEVLLRAFGVLAPQPAFVEFTGPDGIERARYQLNSQKPEFNVTKKPGTFRIMIAGGSTAIGFPYHPRSSMGLRLEKMIEGSLPEVDVEIINLGKVNMNASEVKDVITKAIKYSPDLMIVCSGQNELITLLRTNTFVSLVLPKPQNPGLGRPRVLRALGAGAAILIGGASSGFIRSVENNPEAGLELPPPTPLDPGLYEQAMTEYGQILGDVASLCKANKVPLVISTMASNLRGWPPDPRSIPAGISDKREEAWSKILEARKLMDDGNFDESKKLLYKTREMFPGYPATSFELGRVETRMAEISMNRDELRTQALVDFKRALDEESHIVMSNRAPLEVSGIARKVANESGALLFDTEKLFNDAGINAPGFDWFVDHCHPTLAGQQLMAEDLIKLLRKNNIPRPSAEWIDGPAWDEDAFLVSQNMDDVFMHDLYVRMGIYLGLEKELPDHSLATREMLEKAGYTGPADPLPALLRATIFAYYGETNKAANELFLFYPEKSALLDKCLSRYFAAVEIRQGVFMARLSPGAGRPPLRGLLKSGMFDAKGQDNNNPKTPSELDVYNYFLDLDDGGVQVTYQTDIKLKTLKNHVRPKTPFVMSDPENGVTLAPGPNVKLVKISEQSEYLFSGPHDYLTAPNLKIKPLDYTVLRISSPTNGSINIRWIYYDQTGRMRDAEYEAHSAEGEFVINLDRLPRWVLAREIIEIRTSPGKAGSFSIGDMRLE